MSFSFESSTLASAWSQNAKLSFSADQVTTEKVGVEVRGLAVYRIADPLLAFRMIDIDRSTLTEILRDMFVGATRRIVASLTLDECITHRKDLVATAQNLKTLAKHSWRPPPNLSTVALA